MVERTQEEIEALLKQFTGMKVKPSIYAIRGKMMAKYAEAIGDNNPKYTQAVDGSWEKTLAHPAYAAYYTIPGLFDLADLKDTEGNPLITNIGKLLHTGQNYDFTGCVPLTEEASMNDEGKGRVYSSGYISNLYVKSEWLWMEVKLTTTNKAGDKTFCNTTLTAAVRKGGF
jgi:hypothetical protein